MRKMKFISGVVLAGLLLAVFGTAPAFASPNKPKITKPAQLQSKVIDPAKAKAATGYPGDLAKAAGGDKCGSEGRSFFCESLWAPSGTPPTPYPYFIAVEVYSSPKEAKRALASTKLGGSEKLVSKSASRLVVSQDASPGSDFDDAVRVAQVSGRFLIEAACGFDQTANNFEGLTQCAQKLAKAQVQELRSVR